MNLRTCFFLGLLFVGCGGLPEYAAPKQASLDGRNPLEGDLIAYRKLERGDFRGKEAPEAFRAVKDRVGAATCARIVSDPPAEIEITQTTSPKGETSVTGRIKTVGYRALMDRACSWWNDKAKDQDPVYVLQHEQIHFALFEVEARRLDKEVQELAHDHVFEGDSVDEVKEDVQSRIQGLFDDTSETLLERNRDFDEDTSLGYKPAQQQEWFDTVTRQLAGD
jgi:hypothetical protein